MSSRVTYPSIIEILNDFLSQIKVIELNNRKIVFKNYRREHGLIKWFLIKIGSNISKTYPYAIDPYERMIRETSFFNEMIDVLNTPRVLLKDWINLLIAREFIEGFSSKPDNEDDLRNISRLIACIHEYGYVLGDTKFYNFVKTNSKYYIIDAEQAIASSNEKYMYWDLLVFVIVSTYYIINKYLTKAIDTAQYVIKTFLENYVDERGYKAISVLKNYDLLNYKSLVYILLPIPINTYYLRIVDKIISSR